jgi:hypothetical protein
VHSHQARPPPYSLEQIKTKYFHIVTCLELTNKEVCASGTRRDEPCDDGAGRD